ncbi:HNH endonuclease [Mesorhizobium sp. ASY16-5R]|uniref:HNH endonuclease n=1 Tax=Mesorhizobium sp. ASY16-5R TaxID=3445772 RepID=UPI003FA0AD8E
MPRQERGLPAYTLYQVKADMIHRAVSALRDGKTHAFGRSTDYDVLLPSGERLPPKAVFGLALEEVIRQPAIPEYFKGGSRTICFKVIQRAGYRIVPKAEWYEDADDDSVQEGTAVLRLHFEKERSSALVRDFKSRFRVANGGKLICQVCGLDPETLGPFGDACIEVHHSDTPVAKMKPGHRSKTSHLMAVCANCHRIIHRQMLAAG